MDRYFDEIFITGCTGICLKDNSHSSKWQDFRLMTCAFLGAGLLGFGTYKFLWHVYRQYLEAPSGHSRQITQNDLSITMGSRPGARFTNGFSIAIQIRWKFRFTPTSIMIQWSLQNFVHGTTAVLSWHVQKFVAIRWPTTELWQVEVSIEFELRAKNR